MTPKIFISYRRLDSQDFTDRLFETLVNQFGAQNVFQDVGDSGKIPPGVDFVEYLAEQVRACDVVLVVIGDQWTRILKERAQRDDDFVRIEVESALSQGKIVIPVLKSATQMPNGADLPESIRKLVRINASRVRPNPDFTRDCQTLAEGIRTVYAMRHPSAPAPEPKPVTPPSVRDILPPPFAWIEIPAGEFTMGGNPPRKVTLPTFWIAKYPVTNAQYAKFIDAGGYRERKWWTDAGWSWREKEKKTQPDYWTHSDFNGAEQPVVGVSWYEVVAFTQWLSEVTGQKITLPLEAQWEKAARGTDARVYPWGNTFDRNRCNTAESKIGKTTPVRQYEGKGDSPYGVVDMAGNVWEWCLDDYSSPQLDPSKVNMRAANSRVLRGGSFGTHPNYAAASYRGNNLPYYVSSSYGLRLVLSAP